MTPEEYLKQAYRLDQRIRLDTEEVKRLRELSCSVSAICYDRERVQASHPSDAPFVQALERLEELEKKIADELNLLSELKEQIQEVIRALPSMDEQLILNYRYLCSMTWKEIGAELHIDRTTAFRWHDNALSHITLPENPVIV
jgi:DNA-directed RNA polymerase specialized sigma subunit